MSREAVLNQLLRSLFSADELRTHLGNEREGSELLADLPGTEVSLNKLVAEAGGVLCRRGLVDREFFDGLEAVRHQRLDEIRRVRALWLHNPRLDAGELWAEGRYRLERSLGRGGFGTVWRAIDTRTETVVALKILLEQHTDDRRTRLRFFRGAAALAKLSHPAIVRVLSGVEQEGFRFFYVMECLDGRCLDASIKERSPAEMFEYVLQIGGALAAVHTCQLLHRDVKPSNILITAYGQAKLIDFDFVSGNDHLALTTRVC